MYKQMAHLEGASLNDLEMLSPSPISPPSSEPNSLQRMLFSVSKKTLYYLRATLNAAYGPDYDFSCVGGEGEGEGTAPGTARTVT